MFCGVALEKSEVLAVLAASPPVVDRGVLEGIAVAAHAEANLPLWFPRGARLAKALGVVVLRNPMVLEGQASLVDGVATVRPAKSRRVESLAVFHELAHHLLRKRHHRHGDVWLLALALAIPGDRTEYVDDFRMRVPDWAVELRFEMLKERAA